MFGCPYPTSVSLKAPVLILITTVKQCTWLGNTMCCRFKQCICQVVGHQHFIYMVILTYQIKHMVSKSFKCGACKGLSPEVPQEDIDDHSL